jgi:hypothetical protein
MFFRNRGDRNARLIAWQSESERLSGMPVRELAAEVMQAFGPHGINAKPGCQQGPYEVVSWLLPGAPARFRVPVNQPVIEALGVLEHADLLVRRVFGEGGTTYRVSRLGQAALEQGAVRGHLGCGTT